MKLPTIRHSLMLLAVFGCYEGISIYQFNGSWLGILLTYLQAVLFLLFASKAWRFNNSGPYVVMCLALFNPTWVLLRWKKHVDVVDLIRDELSQPWLPAGVARTYSGMDFKNMDTEYLVAFLDYLMVFREGVTPEP